MGLSPLARGNQPECCRPGRAGGPIPARAGQPIRRTRSTRPSWAYPRSRGATDIGKSDGCAIWGLSPLARGNPRRPLPQAWPPGPIPARAGQPGGPCSLSCAAWAYPRSRGATSSLPAPWALDGGLSPLARGNPGQRQHRALFRGPIPARAGQPEWLFREYPWIRAYPRSRGATVPWQMCRAAWPGLSPLARGNRGSLARIEQPGGPIPARAGQPMWGRRARRALWAYPRSRGATVLHSQAVSPSKGLSPLARGNHWLPQFFSLPSGPIPARAGQPSRHLRGAGWHGAYPRSRGATNITRLELDYMKGLSPLARGNL